MRTFNRKERLEFRRMMHERYIRSRMGFCWRIDIEGSKAVVHTLGGTPTIRFPARWLLEPDCIERLIGTRHAEASGDADIAERNKEKLKLAAKR